MGISPMELAVQRKNTKAFIRADAEVFVLERSAFASDGAGGHTRGTPAPLPPQLMRLVPLQDGSTPQLTADGEMIEPSYILIGHHDADMERWDTFTTDNGRYEIVSVNLNRQYECKGEVAYRGL